ncbi:YciI family protein [Jeotgalibacillus proteolyticus]|uniref:YCII-related domain-containing protein n=1 Tax=Jeotgalibacillus proteolyticus TaxID=2082395 RepID=A0A2S5GCY5_9BACL|nr:YciI family protein [Jeotgalibacillus proteolyticus]PPA70866.1 hypothetical protein C4B60_08750 [Jeotgalibacillus proteolyticus]
MKALILYSCGRAWDSGSQDWEQQVTSHRKYIVSKMKDRLIAGGPFMDHTGELVILEVENLDEALELAKNDPAVRDGRFEYVVKPWEPIDGIFNPPGQL